MKLAWFKVWSNLSTRITVSLIGLVLLTALAVGAPAIILLRHQLNEQAWLQVRQTSQITQALYAAKKSQLASLATLTAQRPTLARLLEQSDQSHLLAYLHTLQLGTRLDGLLICTLTGDIVAEVGQPMPSAICQATLVSPIFVDSQLTPPHVWLLARHDIVDLSYKVVVGAALDNYFTQQLGEQTGLQQTLFWQKVIVATNFKQPFNPDITSDNGNLCFNLADIPYYATLTPLESPDLAMLVALDVSQIAMTQQQLSGWLIAVMVTIITLSSVIGIGLAHQISRPLARLEDAAAHFSQGQLDTPVKVKTHLREVLLLAQTIELARTKLKYNLNELRAEKEWSENLLRAIVEGIVTLDANGRITFFSHGAERITGWSAVEVMGRLGDELFILLDTPELFSQLIPPPGRRRKVTLKLEGEQAVILAITGAHLLPSAVKGGERGVAIVFRDISEEEAVHRLLSDFLANITHEFRTPLSALNASLELLLDEAEDLSAVEMRELLKPTHLSLISLQTLIDNLLETSSIEAGRFTIRPRPTQLHQILTEAIHIIQPLLERRRQTLTIAESLSLTELNLMADPTRLVQVLVNLLSNASKYSPLGSEINVWVEEQLPPLAPPMSGGNQVQLPPDVGGAGGGKQRWVRISVADQGSGIPMAEQGQLFRRFVRLHNPNGEQYGVGLGLYVVKTIVEAHGGQVGVADRPGGGALFWFELPL